MNMLMRRNHDHPWIADFRREPTAALDDLLRGLARVPPYERGTPSEILKRLFGTLPMDDADLRLLDESLRAWLEKRWREGTAERREAYGLARFVTETMDALAAVWLLALPQCRDWLQENYLALARWAAPLRLSKMWDLPRALAQAAALTQNDPRLRLYWFRLCSDAARPSQRAMIDPALVGVSFLPGAAGQGASQDLIAGLARFGAALVATPRDQSDFLRRWRALKARFPRVSKTWHRLWHGVLVDRRYDDKPFREWLIESDPGLGRPWTGAPAAEPPPKHRLDALFERIHRGERETVLPEALALFEGYLHHTEATGDAYFVVRYASNVGKEIVSWAPGHALAWAREVLRWEPSNAQAWSLRGRALTRLGRADLAQSVYWEAARRLPDNAVVRSQLALLLAEEGRGREAEALLREAHALGPKDEVARVELAHLFARMDRLDETEALLRRCIEELPENRIAPYTLAYFLIAWGRPAEAVAVLASYVARFGRDQWTKTLDWLLEEGPAGAEDARRHLAKRRPGLEDAAPLVNADSRLAEREAAAEARAGEAVWRSARVSHADLLFRLDAGEAAEAVLSGVIEGDADDVYANVVWALHDPARRPGLAARYRESFGVLAPHLAAASPANAVQFWDRLRDEFPERRPLIDFTRLMRSAHDEATAQRLGSWIEGGEEDGDAYFRNRLRLLVASNRLDPEALELRALLGAAIRREVDLGDLALDEVA